MLVLMNLMICESPSCSPIVSGLLSLRDILLSEECREKHLARIVRDNTLHASTNAKKLHTIPYNFIYKATSGLELWRFVCRLFVVDVTCEQALC